MCLGEVERYRENDIEPRVAEFAIRAQVSFFACFSVVSFLFASSDHSFSCIASLCYVARECVEER